jgi:hypothetical protein
LAPCDDVSNIFAANIWNNHSKKTPLPLSTNGNPEQEYGVSRVLKDQALWPLKPDDQYKLSREVSTIVSDKATSAVQSECSKVLIVGQIEVGGWYIGQIYFLL